jgi:tripartite-type tricarboxylate transporter receptor subunit TctC
MMHIPHLLRVSAIALIAISTAPHGARAQAYPSQDVNFICGFAAGSGADIIVRYFADKLRPVMNRTIIVQNKPGALGNIATEYVARAKPDGYTILVTGGNSVAASMHLFKKPSVDVAKAFQIAATINNATMMIAVPADSPVKTAEGEGQQGDLRVRQSDLAGAGRDVQGEGGSAGGRGGLPHRRRLPQ